MEMKRSASVGIGVVDAVAQADEGIGRAGEQDAVVVGMLEAALESLATSSVTSASVSPFGPIAPGIASTVAGIDDDRLDAQVEQ
jgi:hypothetical protein